MSEELFIQICRSVTDRMEGPQGVKMQQDNDREMSHIIFDKV